MTKARKSARGERCTLRLVGICTDYQTDVVLCHVRDFGGGGIGQKPPDRRAVYACQTCHDALDGRNKPPVDWPESRYEDILRAVFETHDRFVALGIMECT